MRTEPLNLIAAQINPAARAQLRAANTELMHIDLRISRLETVLKQLLEPAQGMDNPTPCRVEPHRRPC